MRYLIGVDVGTSGTKAALFDELGRTVASKTIDYPMYQPKNGWAEQDPEDWRRAALGAISEVSSKIPVGSVAALGVTGQMHGLVMLGERGEVLRRAIIWCDQRTGEECRELEALVGRDRLISISANPAMTGFTASKLVWVKKHEPEIFDRCRHILLPKDYIRYVLTGEFATDVSDASGMQLLDVPHREWSDELLDLLGIRREMLGRVYESPEVTGFVSKEAAALCRIPAGTPVVAGAGDNAAAAVGMGVVTEGEAFTTIGTSGVVFAHTKRPLIDPLGRIHTFCCAVPGEWHVMGVTQAAGLSMRWLRDTVCSAEVLEAGKTCVDPYEVMTAKAKNSPIGANRLIYLPYLMGERTPHADPDCRGAFIGLSASHTRSDLIRSVMEGVSYSLRDCLEVLAEVGIKPESMKICGGGARSPLWRQMLADVYELPICQTGSDEGPALGAALLASVGCGIYGSVGEACKAAVTARGQVLPDKKRSGRYGEFYEIYKGLYKSLKDSFGRLSTL